MKIIMSIWLFVRRCWIWIKMLWSEFYVQAFVLGALVLVYYFITKDIDVSPEQVGTVQECLNDIQKFFNNTQTNFLTLFGSILAIMVGLFVYKAQKRVLAWDIRNRLICEYDELYRHLQRNLEVLNAIKIDRKVSVLHIEKLRIAISQTFTDGELMRNMSKKYTAIVFPLSVRMRNYNITVDCLKEALKENKKALFKSYLDEIISVTEVLQKDIDKDSKKKLVHEVSCKEEDKKVIIYDGKWEKCDAK